LSPTATPLTWLALRAIALYQRHLSPRKGYCCALHAAGRGRSCSAYGYRAIARGGLLTGLVLLRRRVAACGRVHAAARPAVRYQPGMAYQRGFCDPGCDIGGCDIDVCGAADCCSGGCEWPWRRREATPQANLDDHLNNENRLRERIRQAQEQARKNR
jgi:putative component of membrane protein insertase Oxa1/YidC/SpoIIIJ protein YidD